MRERAQRTRPPCVRRQIGAVAADLQRGHGVDLRCGVTVSSLEGDGDGRLRRAHLSDGTTVDTDVAVVALGAVRNTEWLHGPGLAAGVWGVGCDPPWCHCDHRPRLYRVSLRAAPSLYLVGPPVCSHDRAVTGRRTRARHADTM
ncbi:FAD-dependent oxidoreductase [Dactylosporangium cerinum]|uniref:FAD-dependent oxidoreductase n=1 Tax=Dactylosporangium cerinum TaxID=1434730 RepID=A0ABV9VII3_9ACTN